MDRPRLAFIAAAQAESLLGRIDEAVALRDECRRISESLGGLKRSKQFRPVESRFPEEVAP